MAGNGDGRVQRGFPGQRQGQRVATLTPLVWLAQFLYFETIIPVCVTTLLMDIQTLPLCRMELEQPITDTSFVRLPIFDTLVESDSTLRAVLMLFEHFRQSPI